MKVDENKEEQRLVEEQRRAEEKEKTAKEDDMLHPYITASRTSSQN